MTIGRSAAVLAAALLAGCVTPPKPTAFDNSVTISRSKDAVWESLIGYFTANNIQVKTIEKDSGVIYAERMAFDTGIGDLADCGKSAFEVDVGSTVGLNVFARSISASVTEVTVNAQFQVARMFDGQTRSYPCLSKGRLEAEILAAISGSAGS